MRAENYEIDSNDKENIREIEEKIEKRHISYTVASN
ncbi:FbpB family small basic protein [Bacillus multifaciens]|nr:FbpB family small basic protein [Bacillus sp. WLY-B-L8]MDP7980795.1 FbpB family small basic protein [Bacillus sp. WLY-B-L8]